MDPLNHIMAQIAKEPECSRRNPCGNSSCQLCCDHTDMDSGICLDCGLDRTEDLAAQAYDRAKAMRQDG